MTSTFIEEVMIRCGKIYHASHSDEGSVPSNLFLYVCSPLVTDVAVLQVPPLNAPTFMSWTVVGFTINRNFMDINDQDTGDMNTVHQWIQTSLNLFESVKVRKGVSLAEMGSDHGLAPSRWQSLSDLRIAFFLTHTSITRTARLNGFSMDIELTDYCQSTSVFLLSVWLISFSRNHVAVTCELMV